MKSNRIQTVALPTPRRCGRDNPCAAARAARLLLVCCGLLAAAVSTGAAVLTWDADSATPGAQDGSGNWGDADLWWTGSANQTWADGNTAWFGSGSGTAGDYFVTNASTLVSATSVIFGAPGNYTLTTDGMNTGQITVTAGTGTPGFVANGATGVINVPWGRSANSTINATNGVLTFGMGTVSATGGNLVGNNGTINFTNGTMSLSSGASSTVDAMGATVNILGSAIVNVAGRIDIARSTVNLPTVVNVGGPGATAQLNVNTSSGNNTGSHLQIARGGGPAGTLNILPGGLVSTIAGFSGSTVVAGNFRIAPDNANSQGTVNMSGGTLNVGIGAVGLPGYGNPSLASITMFDAVAPTANASAIFNLSGGIAGARAFTIGNGSAFSGDATNWINITGGALYLDAANFSINTPTKTSGANYQFNLSGGLIGATANWSPACSLPINLTNINGNITFQAADAGGSPWDIALSGPLTGEGGLNKTGGGVLTLSGANHYSGTTLVSDGTLVVSTANGPVTGPVTVQGATATPGYPVVSVLVANVGQNWTMGNLTYAGGTPTASFNYGAFTPSASVAPLQVNGNLAFNVTPLVAVEGAAIPSGTYPLIKYTGTLSGTPPTSLASLPAGALSATLVNNTANKSLDLQIVSLISPDLTWAVGSGVWDTSTLNWKRLGVLTAYQELEAVRFDDSAGGPFPITVTLNQDRTPGTVSVNTTNSYTITGAGGIAGSASLIKDGSGRLTLSGPNTYTGGTLNNHGVLNINYGGDGVSSSAIGSGTLTNAPGSAIDNTSGQPVTLLTPIQQVWAGDFSFIGTTNLNLGSGGITLGSSFVNLTVVSNVLEVDGYITDNGMGYGLGKFGEGTLILSNYNGFSGGLTLSAGKLDLNSSGADGSGLLVLNGGTLDNTSGQLVTLSSANINFAGNFRFAGTTDLNLGAATVNVLNSTLTVQSNTLYMEGRLTGANTPLTFNGPGTWTIAGGSGTSSGVQLTINSGVVNCARNSPFTALGATTTLKTGGSLVMLNPTGSQLGTTTTLLLQGGLLEMLGDSETVQLVAFNASGGIIRNSAESTTSTLRAVGGIALIGTNCVFDVTNNAILAVAGVVSNTGSLFKTGGGLLNLYSNNTYTGDTTISGGTLVLNYPGLTNTATVTVDTHAMLELNFTETNTVAALVLNGVSKPAGLYNATTDPVYLAGTGSLLVQPLVATNPTNLTFSVSGSTLSLSWPAAYLGWTLQTNAVGVASPASWFPYPGSAEVTNVAITLDPAATNVFFRLVYP